MEICIFYGFLASWLVIIQFQLGEGNMCSPERSSRSDVSSKKDVLTNFLQKQPSRGVLRKRCPENMQQIYRKPMSKCDFNEFALQFY